MSKTSLLSDTYPCTRRALRARVAQYPVPRKQRKVGEASQKSRAVMLVLAMLGSALLTNCERHAEKAEWRKYDIGDGNFSISFPSAPATRSEPLHFGGEAAEMTVVTSEIGSAQYVVAYFDVPGGNVLPDSPQGFFDQLQAYIVQKNLGTITGTKEVPLGRFTGRELQMSSSRGLHFVRLFYVRSRFFQVHAIVPKGEQSEVGVTTFLKSFKLLRP